MVTQKMMMFNVQLGNCCFFTMLQSYKATSDLLTCILHVHRRTVKCRPGGYNLSKSLNFMNKYIVTPNILTQSFLSPHPAASGKLLGKIIPYAIKTAPQTWSESQRLTASPRHGLEVPHWTVDGRVSVFFSK